MSIVCPGRSSLKRSAIASAHTDDVEAPLPAAAAALDAVLAAAVLAAAPLPSGAAPLPSAAAPLTGASPSGKSTALPVRKWAWVMGSTVALLLTPSTAKSCSCLAASELAPGEVLGPIGGRRRGAHRELVVEEEQIHATIVAIPLAVALRFWALVCAGEALVEGEALAAAVRLHADVELFVLAQGDAVERHVVGDELAARLRARFAVHRELRATCFDARVDGRVVLLLVPLDGGRLRWARVVAGQLQQ